MHHPPDETLPDRRRRHRRRTRRCARVPHKVRAAHHRTSFECDDDEGLHGGDTPCGLLPRGNLRRRHVADDIGTEPSDNDAVAHNDAAARDHEPGRHDDGSIDEHDDHDDTFGKENRDR